MTNLRLVGYTLFTLWLSGCDRIFTVSRSKAFSVYCDTVVRPSRVRHPSRVTHAVTAGEHLVPPTKLGSVVILFNPRIQENDDSHKKTETPPHPHRHRRIGT